MPNTWAATDVHHLTGVARSTIGRWLQWYRDEGVGALEALPAGRAPVLPVAKIVTLLVLLMQFSPQDFGYQRSRWCTELLAIKINRLTHWILDVSLREDACQIYRDNGAENLAGLRHMVLNMLRAEETKISIPMKQKRCMMNPAFLERVLLAGFASMAN